MRDQAGNTFTAIVAITITCKGPPPPFKHGQAVADLAAGTHQTHASRMGLTDQLERLAPVNGTAQPSASYEQKASHLFRDTNKAAISPMTFSLRYSSFLRALIYRWSWTRSFSSSFALSV